MENAIVKYGEEFRGALGGFKAGGNFSKGAEYVLDAVTEYADDFPLGTKFEFIEDANGAIRRVDVVTPGPPKTYFEMKSVKASGIPPEGFSDQFLKDLQIEEITNLDQLKWWFDSNEISDLPKDKFIAKLTESAPADPELIRSLLNKFDIEGDSWIDIVNEVDSKFKTIFEVK